MRILKSVALGLAFAMLGGAASGASARSVGEIMREALRDSLREAGAGPAAATGHAGSVSWRISDSSPGIKRVDGMVPPQVDLSNPDIARNIYQQGCRAAGGGYGWFGTIYAHQNGEVVAQGNLRGCNGQTFAKNVAIERVRARQQVAQDNVARATNQGIGRLQGVELGLVRELNLMVAQAKAHRTCAGGCKAFEVYCLRSRPTSYADGANGITANRFVGLRWLRYGPAYLPGTLMAMSQDRQWYEERRLFLFIHRNDQWTSDGFQGWDERVICGR